MVTTAAATYYRDVNVASGYLSGNPVRVHFGLPATARLQRLHIRRPDGAVSTIDSLQPQTQLTIARLAR